MDDLIEAHQKQQKDKVKRKIYQDVFDDRTEKALFDIERRESLEYIVSPISKGKEANLFVGKAKEGFVAVKIYRLETTNFHRRTDYIDNEDLQHVSKNPIKRIYAWTEREYLNLKACYENGMGVPKPINQVKNVIIMELIGKNRIPHPTLKYDSESKQNIKEIYKQYIENMYKMLYKVKLVHADLSEYNMIFYNKKLYFFDMGQAVETNYKKAKEFVNRDIKIIAKFFNKNGLKVTAKQIKEDIKKYKNKINESD